MVLIVAGVAGIGTVVEKAPWALTVVRWLGVGFLGWYGVTSLLRARRTESLRGRRRGRTSRAAAVGRAVALTWLNPHVYLDTVLLLGTVANHQGRTGALVVRARGVPGERCCGSPGWATAPGWPAGCSPAPAPGRCSTSRSGW